MSTLRQRDSVARVTELPFVDEHTRIVDASPDATWRALTRHATGGLLFGRRNPLALILGTEPRGGFAIADSVDGSTLDLTGRHHFSRYLLRFVLTGVNGKTRLAARTYALFPGPHGRIYRALVIGSGAHAVATRGILRTVAELAERGD
jgi:hypothetical protein